MDNHYSKAEREYAPRNSDISKSSESGKDWNANTSEESRKRHFQRKLRRSQRELAENRGLKAKGKKPHTPQCVVLTLVKEE